MNYDNIFTIACMLIYIIIDSDIVKYDTNTTEYDTMNVVQYNINDINI